MDVYYWIFLLGMFVGLNVLNIVWYIGVDSVRELIFYINLFVNCYVIVFFINFFMNNFVFKYV